MKAERASCGTITRSPASATPGRRGRRGLGLGPDLDEDLLAEVRGHQWKPEPQPRADQRRAGVLATGGDGHPPGPGVPPAYRQPDQRPGRVARRPGGRCRPERDPRHGAGRSAGSARRRWSRPPRSSPTAACYATSSSRTDGPLVVLDDMSAQGRRSLHSLALELLETYPSKCSPTTRSAPWPPGPRPPRCSSRPARLSGYAVSWPTRPTTCS